MAKHELDLLENALDSFNEALRRFQDGEKGEPRAYKFAILHFAHFVELVFKYYVTLSHPLLIYRNPFARDVHKQNTIGLWDAVQFLKNEGRQWEPDFEKDLEWLKKIRNSIEHYKFTMEVAEVRETLGRLTKAVLQLNDYFDELKIREHVDPENLKIFEALSDEYKAKIEAAQREAEAKSEDGEAEHCYYCGNRTAGRIEDAYECQFCGERERILECCVCGGDEREYFMSVWNDDHAPHIDYICDVCHDRIMNM